MAHTSGPWQTAEQANGHFSIWASVERDNGELIATVYDFSHTPTALANLALITAAPDLLAALRRSTDLLAEIFRTIADNDTADEIGEANYAASAAIARAEGHT